jgi:hypothetical protein
MLGAFVSHVAHKDPAWIMVVTVTIAAITLTSWALRPQNRRLGGAANRATLSPLGRTASE